MAKSNRSKSKSSSAEAQLRQQREAAITAEGSTTAVAVLDQPVEGFADILAGAEERADALLAIAPEGTTAEEAADVAEALAALGDQAIVNTEEAAAVVTSEPELAVDAAKPTMGQWWTGFGMHDTLDPHQHVVILTTPRSFKAACTLMLKAAAQGEGEAEARCPDCDSMWTSALSGTGDLVGDEAVAQAVAKLRAGKIAIPSVDDTSSPVDSGSVTRTAAATTTAAKPGRKGKAADAPAAAPKAPEAPAEPAFDALDVIRRLLKGGSFESGPDGELARLEALLDSGTTTLTAALREGPAEGYVRQTCRQCDGHGFRDVAKASNTTTRRGPSANGEVKLQSVRVAGPFLLGYRTSGRQWVIRDTRDHTDAWSMPEVKGSSATAKEQLAKLAGALKLSDAERTKLESVARGYVGSGNTATLAPAKAA